MERFRKQLIRLQSQCLIQETGSGVQFLYYSTYLSVELKLLALTLTLRITVLQQKCPHLIIVCCACTSALATSQRKEYFKDLGSCLRLPWQSFLWSLKHLNNPSPSDTQKRLSFAWVWKDVWSQWYGDQVLCSHLQSIHCASHSELGTRDYSANWADKISSFTERTFLRALGNHFSSSSYSESLPWHAQYQHFKQTCLWFEPHDLQSKWWESWCRAWSWALDVPILRRPRGPLESLNSFEHLELRKKGIWREEWTHGVGWVLM